MLECFWLEHNNLMAEQCSISLESPLYSSATTFCKVAISMSYSHIYQAEWNELGLDQGDLHSPVFYVSASK